MSVKPVDDHGQKMPAPAGRAIGFVDTQLQCDAVTKALSAAGFAESSVFVLHGEDGIQLLERSENDFFMGDAESDVIQFGIAEIRNGHFALGIEANDRDEAIRATNIATQHGGHHFGYFGAWVNEGLTK
ncbi:MAG TPA: hypothetical protein VGY55_16405 [Pirellulales bacterium]|jgi:hypothetical protein|nr:hypothetical protein [Pirellulales bacterium]